MGRNDAIVFTSFFFLSRLFVGNALRAVGGSLVIPPHQFAIAIEQSETVSAPLS